MLSSEYFTNQEIIFSNETFGVNDVLDPLIGSFAKKRGKLVTRVADLVQSGIIGKNPRLHEVIEQFQMKG